jgi:hypothetical protein
MHDEPICTGPDGGLFFKKKLVPHPSLSFSKIKMCTFTPFKINVDFFSESLILDVTVLTRIV